MVRTLLSLILLVAFAGPAGAGIEALDAEDGFRGARFGARLESLPEMQLLSTHAAHGTSLYVRPDESLALGDAKLDGVHLRGANLTDADLTRARCRPVSLTNSKGEPTGRAWAANLSCANLENATLRGADLTQANLMDANLRSADLCDTALTDAKLMGAAMDGGGPPVATLLAAADCAEPSAA